MDYRITFLGEFKNKEIENTFLEGEVRKSITLIRYMILFSSLGFLLAGVTELVFKKNTGLLLFLLVGRIFVFLIGVVLFIGIKRFQKIKTISISICVFATIIYAVYFFFAFSIRPLNIISPTFFVILISTCLLMMPNRWIINICISFAYSVIFTFTVPYICSTTSLEYRIIALAYLFWNIILIGVVFYNNNKYKRNSFAKTLQLENLANTDQLTQINNRKSCDNIIENKCASNMSFSIIMFDIDNFKSINDTYGHVAGDDVLVSITDYTRNIIRKNDVLARWGGEEFVIIMLDTSLSDASELANRLNEQLAVIKHKGIDQAITCSFGVTTFVEGDEVKSIIRRADQLLYLAKEYGKNRVVAG